MIQELKQIMLKGLITGGMELRQQHPRDLLSGAGMSLQSRSRDVPASDSNPRGCWYRISRPTVINPDYDMTEQLCVKRQNTFKISPIPSDVAYLPPLWRHASPLNDGSCSFTHPVVRGNHYSFAPKSYLKTFTRGMKLHHEYRIAGRCAYFIFFYHFMHAGASSGYMFWYMEAMFNNDYYGVQLHSYKHECQSITWHKAKLV